MVVCYGDVDCEDCTAFVDPCFLSIVFVTGTLSTLFPQGREASFSALAAAPLFAAKVPVGLLSGYLVHKYLPEDGSRKDGRTMWLIIGLLTM